VAKQQEIHDPRKVPRYTATEVARLVDMPRSTVSAWFFGMGSFKPILVREHHRLLTFENLVEAHVLRAFGRKNVRTPTVRAALKLLGPEFGDHPLATHKFKTDGKHVFLTAFGEHDVNLNQSGQAVFGPILETYLKRIDYELGGAVRLFPARGQTEAKLVVVDPSRNFGKAVLTGTRVPVAEIVSRTRAGETPESIAYDFELAPAKVRKALEWWGQSGEAAAAS
jgi:uncharacterized protein (DUF433 family)